MQKLNGEWQVASGEWGREAYSIDSFPVFLSNITIAIILIFILGYLGIAFEHSIRINKAATALVTGVLFFTFYNPGF